MNLQIKHCMFAMYIRAKCIIIIANNHHHAIVYAIPCSLITNITVIIILFEFWYYYCTLTPLKKIQMTHNLGMSLGSLRFFSQNEYHIF